MLRVGAPGANLSGHIDGHGDLGGGEGAPGGRMSSVVAEGTLLLGSGALG